jgi:hypothetical protein
MSCGEIFMICLASFVLTVERIPCLQVRICAQDLEENRQKFPHPWQHLFCRHPIRRSLVSFLQDDSFCEEETIGCGSLNPDRVCST